MKTRFALAYAATALLSPLALADWQVGPGSQVQFVSIKNNTIGEVSHFETLAGTVTDAGEVEVRVALDSVETNIGIRNERMKKMLFEVGLLPRSRDYRAAGCRGSWLCTLGRRSPMWRYKSIFMARP